MEALIENLELLGRRDKAALLKACQVDEEDLADMVSEIRALDPKPASNSVKKPCKASRPIS